MHRENPTTGLKKKKVTMSPVECFYCGWEVVGADYVSADGSTWVHPMCQTMAAVNEPYKMNDERHAKAGAELIDNSRLVF